MRISTSYRNFITFFTYETLKTIKILLPFHMSLYRNLGAPILTGSKFQFEHFCFVFGIPVLKISITGTNVYN